MEETVLVGANYFVSLASLNIWLKRYHCPVTHLTFFLFLVSLPPVPPSCCSTPFTFVSSVLDSFALSIYDSEEHLLAGSQPDDVIKLHGTSVYDGGKSITLKSTRIHISTEDGGLHCFASVPESPLSSSVELWMAALYKGIEDLSKIDLGSDQSRRAERSVSHDEVDLFDDVGIGYSRRSRNHYLRNKHGGSKRQQLRRTVSQFVRDGGSSSFSLEHVVTHASTHDASTHASSRMPAVHACSRMHAASPVR